VGKVPTLRIAWAILAISAALAVLACFLPDDDYQRWQLLDSTIHSRARWIYERTTFDPTPIDVAVIGPSRTGKGVDAPQLAAALAARGLPDHVVNFSLPESGRNINYVVVEQLLRHKTPKLIVLGVTEKPSRFGHSAFKFIAPARDIVDPGYFPDWNYVSDLIYLPYRQMILAFADAAPGLSNLTKTFDPSRYKGPSLSSSGSLVLPDGTILEGVRPAPLKELMRGVHKLERKNHPPFLPARYADIEFGDERHYVREIAAMAQARGVKVAFVFLPYYTGPATLQEQPLYDSIGPTINEGYLAAHPEWYVDYGHLTLEGARRATAYMVDPIARLLTDAKTRT
jgi:hypothetical protein